MEEDIKILNEYKNIEEELKNKSISEEKRNSLIEKKSKLISQNPWVIPI